MRRGLLVSGWLPAIALLGLLACALGLWLAPLELGFAWIAAHRQALGIAWGALFWLALAELAPMTWFAALRPVSLALGAGALPVALGWIPVLLASPAIYGWVAEPNRPGAVTDRSLWLSVPFFALRTLAVLGLWGALCASARTRHRLAWALAVVIAGGLGWCLFSFDAWMSLAPDWKSSIYGLLPFASGLRDGLAAIIAAGALRDAREPQRLPPDVWHALGRLQLTVLLLWAYLTFCQFLIIWIGGKPDEIGWYLARWYSPARALSWALLLGAFAVGLPLLSRAFKRSRTAMASLAVGVLGLGAIEAAWEVLPHAPSPVSPFWMLAAALAWLGLLSAAAEAVLRRLPPDEDRQASLAYRSR